MSKSLTESAKGCLVGAAVGDALGGPAEGWTPDDLLRRYGGPITGIVPPFYENWKDARPIAPYHKGDGHITDDTIMTHALVRVYHTVRDHLDAYSIAEQLVPDLIGNKVWIPELESEALPLQRIFLAEKWLVARLHYGHIDPREAGVGNIVNCGAAMYMAPVGVVNAGNPAGAYAEAIELAGAHQSSYGREAAGVFAAAVAAAFLPDASPESVVDACLSVAKDGTAAAISAVAEAAEDIDDYLTAIDPLRAAVEPFDTVGPHYRQQGLGARRPSRLHSIEELPIALGMLLVAGGDYRDTVLGGVNYGRDCDSIAGVLGGISGIPADWREDVATASRTDLETPGAQIAEVAREVFVLDRQRRRTHEDGFAAISGNDR